MGEEPQQVLENLTFLMFLVAVKLGGVLESIRKGEQLLDDVPTPLLEIFLVLFLNGVEVDQVDSLVFVFSKGQGV